MGVQNTTNTRDACEQSDVFFVTTLQGWVYKTQPTVSKTRDVFFVTTLHGWVYTTQQVHMRSIRRFLGNNIARMGLQNTPNTCEPSLAVSVAVSVADAFFVTILHGWAYKTNPTHASHQTVYL